MRELLRSPRITVALFYFQFCPFFYHGFWSSAVTHMCKAVGTSSRWLVSLWNLPLMSDNGSHKCNHCTLFSICTVHNFSNIKKNIKGDIFHIASKQFRSNVIINTVGSNRTNKMVAYLLFGPFFPLIYVLGFHLTCNIGLTLLVSHLGGCSELIQCTLVSTPA